MSPALAGVFFTTTPLGKPSTTIKNLIIMKIFEILWELADTETWGHKVSNCSWKNGADNLAQCRGLKNLQFVKKKKAVSAKYNKLMEEYYTCIYEGHVICEHRFTFLSNLDLCLTILSNVILIALIFSGHFLIILKVSLKTVLNW